MNENNIEITKILQSQLENLTQTEEEILNQTNPLTPEEKELALRVIKLITSKNPKDKHLVIDYNILYSHPPEEDKEGIIAQLQEENKFNRKVITEYKNLKEKY
jgi:hypothetical protein